MIDVTVSMRERILRLAAFPFAAFVVGNAVQTSRKLGRFFDPALWGHYDSGHYLQIARTGHNDFFRCGPPAYPPASWCGTAGWMPLYPSLMRLGRAIGFSDGAAGIIISLFFWLATLVLLSWMLRGTRMSTALSVLVLAAVWPGQIYQHAIYPISMITFFVLLAVHLATTRERLVLPGLAGAAAAASYATGFVLAPVLAWWKLVTGSGRHAFGRALVIGGIAACGLLAVMGIQRVQTGSWFAFFHVQGKYGAGLHNPLKTLGHDLTPLTDRILNRSSTPSDADLAPDRREQKQRFRLLSAEQQLFALLLVAAGLWAFLAHDRRAAADLLVAIYVIVFALFPLLVGPATSPYRSQILLMPSAWLFRHVSPVFVTALAIGGSLLAYAMAPYYFSDLMV